MIGRLSSHIIISVFLFSCSSSQEEICDDYQLELETTEEIVDLNVIDNSTFVDPKLSGNIDVQEEEAGVFYAAIASETHEILSYEGLLTGARYAEDGYQLYFEPYSYWDDEMEEEVKSPNHFKTTVYITKEQNNYLGFVDCTNETNQLAWDYFECVFKVNLYLDNEQNNIPLKFSNLGKLEWDG